MPAILPLLLLALAARAAGETATVSLRVDHRAVPGGAWAPLGTLTGTLDGDALAAVPRARSPSLTLTRSTTEAPAGLAEAAAVRGGAYSVRVHLPGAGSSSPPPLVASAPAACALASGGRLALKLDGTAGGSGTGGGVGAGVDVTGVSFDFYSTGCPSGDAPLPPGVPPPAWAPPASVAVPLWLPASAPPLFPPPAGAARGAGVAPPTPTPTPRKEGEEGGDGEGGPPVDNRTWLQKNWMVVLPATLLASNLLGALAAPPQAGGGPQARRGPAAGGAGGR